MSPLILIVYMVWVYERKSRLAKAGASSNKAADVEAEEGEKSGLLADEDKDEDEAPPQYVLANESDSESESDSDSD